MSNANTAVIALPKSNILKPWVVCLSSALFFYFEFIQMGMFNALARPLMSEFAINATQLGRLSATFFYADMIFLLIAGMLIDRFSVRKIILSAMALCTFATFLFAFSTSTFMLGLSHFISGIGHAFCLLSCIKLSTRWFPAKKLALVIGLIVTIGMLGGVTAQAPLTWAAASLGWRTAVMMDGVLGIFIFIIIAYFVEEHPAVTSSNTRVKHQKINFKLVLTNKQNWLAGFYTCFLNLPIILLGELWGVMYLTENRHLTHMQASLVTSMIFFGTILGSPIIGSISDRVGLRRLPMIICALLSILTIFAIIFITQLSFVSLILLFLALGIFTSAQIITYPLLAECNPKKSLATATALASMMIMSGGAMFQPFFGWLLDLSGKHAMVDGTILYTHADFILGMCIIPLAFALGLIAAMLMRETYGEVRG